MPAMGLDHMVRRPPCSAADGDDHGGIALLMALGVDAAVEEVYLELLAAPDADTAAVADRLQRTEQQVRAALDTLAELALLRPSRADPTRMVPLSPPLALQTL